MIKLDKDIILTAMSVYELKRKGELESLQTVLDELNSYPSDNVTKESISLQEERIASVKQELSKIQQFYAQFDKPICEYEILAEEK